MTTETIPRLLVDLNEAARLISCSRTFVKRLIARGELSSVKIGASRRIRLADLEAYIDARMGNPL